MQENESHYRFSAPTLSKGNDTTERVVEFVADLKDEYGMSESQALMYCVRQQCQREDL